MMRYLKKLFLKNGDSSLNIHFQDGKLCFDSTNVDDILFKDGLKEYSIKDICKIQDLETQYNDLQTKYDDLELKYNTLIEEFNMIKETHICDNLLNLCNENLYEITNTGTIKAIESVQVGQF